MVQSYTDPVPGRDKYVVRQKTSDVCLLVIDNKFKAINDLANAEIDLLQPNPVKHQEAAFSVTDLYSRQRDETLAQMLPQSTFRTHIPDNKRRSRKKKVVEVGQQVENKLINVYGERALWNYEGATDPNSDFQQAPRRITLRDLTMYLKKNPGVPNRRLNLQFQFIC